MDLLPSEQQAAAFVRSIGIDRAERILSAIARRFDRRYAKACTESFAPINREWVKQTELEVELTHRIKLGLMLVDDYHTPKAAHARILKRLADRNTSKKCLFPLKENPDA